MFQGKVALITGSTSGIAMAIARAMAKEGADIVLNGLGDLDAIEAERRRLAEEFGVQVLYSPADMSVGAEIAEMVHAAQATLGAVDILVNNAGVQFVSPIEDLPGDKWEQLVAINLSSVFYASKAVLPAMKARRWGRIINTASAHALIASPFKSAYVAAKHGIAGLTKTLALECAPFGITANAICPGYVWTPLVEQQIPNTMAARNITREQVINDVMLATQPTKQFVTVEEVAGLAVYLASDLARSITGSTVSIDGGWTAH